MTDTSGFYKFNPDNPNAIDWAQYDVTGPGYELYRQGHEQVTYPVQGWWWFDSRAEARAALVPASTGKLDAQALQDIRDQIQPDPQQLAQTLGGLIDLLTDIAV
jgi:hypothetical protein